MKKTANNIIVLQEVDSTNNYANQLILTDSAEHGAVVLAHYQKKGKGQAGNYWESEANKNLLASMILFPEFIPADKQFYLSKITSLAIAGVLEEYTGSISVKWPNDIYFENKKIAGILIENSVKGDVLNTSILGMGVNVNQEKFTSGAPNPVSLKQITGKETDIQQLARQLITRIHHWYRMLSAGELNAIDEMYRRKLFRNNKWALYKKNNEEFEARIKGIGDLGQLFLEDRQGNTSAYFFKEIEFVL
ncbi:MAG: biotin--[acetyl-CoA-carboxylase] ligase [Prolixibacteraceae bacterium]